jgi:hypothetical protein
MKQRFAEMSRMSRVVVGNTVILVDEVVVGQDFSVFRCCRHSTIALYVYFVLSAIDDM